MDKIVGVIGSVPSLQKNKDDSLTDRLSHKYTVALLILFSVIVSAKQYVGEPINCWVPAHFSDSWEGYANSYCWIKNTYYLPYGSYIPKEDEADKRDMITYYQWVPLILLVQALVFYLPCMVWKTLNARSGIDVNNIVDTCQTFQMLDKVENKNKALDQMTKQMYRYADSHRNYSGSMTLSIKDCCSRIFCFMCGRRRGNYLVTLYIIVKILYILNIVGQIFVLGEFLGFNYFSYGIQFFKSLAYGESEEMVIVPAFPRVTMCDFRVRVLGNVQRYTVQCVLPINLFNEMIYLFLWWWLMLVGILSILSLLSWFVKIVLNRDGERFMKKHLMLLNRIFPRDPNDLIDSEYLTVEFTECSDDLLVASNDKYAHLRQILTDKHKKLGMPIQLSPEADKHLLHEILQVDPQDGRALFRVHGQPGHDICSEFLKLLRKDGVFVLRIVGNNTNSITTTEVTCALWDKFCERYFIKRV